MSYISYSQAEFPPYPAVTIELECLLGATDPVRAKINTGATRTMVPTELLEQVGAIRTGRVVSCLSYDGKKRQWPLYEVTIRVCGECWPDAVGNAFESSSVLGVDEQAEFLLGRDILAAWNLHLDGPNSRYSVS